MQRPWTILTRRYGEDSREPTVALLTEAIAELYHETMPGMTVDDYAEHGAAFLRFGFDDWPMFVLDVDRLQNVTFEEWADQDYEVELALPRAMRAVPEELAVRLWIWLAQGDLERIRLQPWEAI